MKTSNYKRIASGLSASALALGLIAVAQDAMAAATSGTSVVNTRHNLSNTRADSPGDIYVTNSPGGDGDITQICVFCHTPHGADTTVPVPLWNKKTTGNTYTAYTMMGRDSMGTATVAGMSLACLTCHDGTQAMDVFMNAPGIHINGTDGTTQSAGYSWTGAGAVSDGADVVGGKLNGGRTNAALETGPILGTDLSNDHPIGMTYCGKQPTAGTCDDWEASNFVSPGSLSTTIKIFGSARKGGGSGAGTGFADSTNNGTVECASCHNPHGTGNEALLRVTREGSAICLACHIK